MRTNQEHSYINIQFRKIILILILILILVTVPIPTQPIDNEGKEIETDSNLLLEKFHNSILTVWLRSQVYCFRD